MVLPAALRTLVPDAVRDQRRLRATMLAAGLIPPRTMHTAAEAATLRRLAAGAKRVVEIGVYEGSSAIAIAAALGPEAELHLVDPFLDESGWTMRPGWQGVPAATRRAVRRHVRRGPGAPTLRWHLARSQDVGRSWAGPELDLVFIDGDHSYPGCREDWELWHLHVRSGGAVAIHDARLGARDGSGGPGPTQVVDELFRGELPLAEWTIETEVDSLVVLRNDG